MRPLPPRPEMERAFFASDASYDGLFFTGVRTTGIFCRPSCRARKPRPQNVQFFADARAAVFAGYRACQRCHPLAEPGRPAWVAKLLERVEREPERRLRDQDLRAMGIEPERARRHFRSHYAMTFHAYARARRLGDALAQLREGRPLDDVALSSGFESHSGFRDAFSRAFGSAPGRARGALAVRVAWLESPLGPLVAGATTDGVCLLEFSDRRMLETQLRVLQRRLGPALPGASPHLERLRQELQEYFAGRRREFGVPLVAPGTAFEERVWTALRRIPFGETWSYAELARRVGSPGASRAAGSANGRNRLAILIPCHRVVNKDGRLGGYGGGVWRKQALLHLERTGEPLLAAAPQAATAGH
ncbi:MAG: bifunctional transcriptional activator/DNA repair enzyme AdaA [Vicinamibacteria bacterium]